MFTACIFSMSVLTLIDGQNKADIIFSHYIIIQINVYYVKITETCYSTCVSFHISLLIASFALIWKSLWIKASAK